MPNPKPLQKPMFCFTSDLDWNSGTAIFGVFTAFGDATPLRRDLRIDLLDVGAGRMWLLQKGE